MGGQKHRKILSLYAKVSDVPSFTENVLLCTVVCRLLLFIHLYF